MFCLYDRAYFHVCFPCFNISLLIIFYSSVSRGARGHDCCRVSEVGGRENKKGSETGLRNSIILDVLANFIVTRIVPAHQLGDTNEDLLARHSFLTTRGFLALADPNRIPS